MVTVSVIMPVYNTNLNLLRRAIDSILSQTLDGIELILVDDGSTNGSEKICEEYVAKDNRVTVIHQKNKGICAARNIGLKVASGQYIAFCDHDDEFGDNQLKDNYYLAIKHGADVVKFGYKYICLDDSPRFPFGKYSSDVLEEVMDRGRIVGRYSTLKDCGILIFVWDGIYKKNFLENNNCIFDTCFTLGQEDIDFNNLIIEYANVIVYNNKQYYRHYRYNESTSRGMNNKKGRLLINDQKKIFRREIELCLKLVSEGMPISDLSRIYYRNYLTILSTTMRRDFSCRDNERKYILEKLYKEFFFKSRFPVHIGKLHGIKNRLCFMLFLKKRYTLLFCLLRLYLKII